MRLVNPAPILLGDQHHENNSERSVAAPSDMAPYLPRGEVVLTGHAHAPTPSPMVQVRLAVMGNRPLVDKTLQVFGERMWTEGDQLTAPVPFTRLPLRYERGATGPVGYEENPVGMVKGVGLPAHNIVDPQDQDACAGFGAISGRWQTRKRLLRNLDAAVLDQSEPALPDTFAWSYFHVAPPDQRCPFFEGTEWLVLEGLHPEFQRFESQLPSALGQARVYSTSHSEFETVPMFADTLWVDSDRSLCCVSWRGNFEVQQDVSPLQIFAGLEMPGRPVPWPMPSLPPPAPAAVPAAMSLVEPTYAGQALPAPSLPNTQAAPEPTERAGKAASVEVDPKAELKRTLASPGTATSAMIETVVRGRAPARTAPPEVTSPRAAVQPRLEPAPGPESVTSIKVDPAWLDEAERRALAGDAATDSERLNSTMTQAPSELQSLLAKAAPSAPAPLRRGPFEDSPTVAPDIDQLAQIIRTAEASSAQTVEPARTPPPKAEPVGTRPEPVAVRALRTTIRGLGVGARDSAPPSEEEPPPTNAGNVAHDLLSGGDGPTRQLAVPDALLRMSAGASGLSAEPTVVATNAAQLAATMAPATSPNPEPSWAAPESVAAVVAPSQHGSVLIAQPMDDFDEDETGRPTMTGMEAPPISAQSPLPQVHRGETKMEVERRMREGEPLEGLDLSNLDLAGFDFSGKVLSRCKFDRASLVRCRFIGTNLAGASFRGADLTNATLESANLERASFAASKLDGASLRGAFLSDASFSGAEGKRPIFDASSGQRITFARCELLDAQFLGVQYDAADFTEASLDGANLEGSLLPDLKASELSARGAVFSRSTLQNAQFTQARLPAALFDLVIAEESNWESASVEGGSLAGARLAGASFASATLRGVDLRGALIAEARFPNADLSNANIAGLDPTGLGLDGANLTGALR
jgi:uncharacterized protein YjbI with pentapeptide repeats